MLNKKYFNFGGLHRPSGWGSIFSPLVIYRSFTSTTYLKNSISPSGIELLKGIISKYEDLKDFYLNFEESLNKKDKDSIHYTISDQTEFEVKIKNNRFYVLKYDLVDNSLHIRKFNKLGSLISHHIDTPISDKVFKRVSNKTTE